MCVCACWRTTERIEKEAGSLAVTHKKRKDSCHLNKQDICSCSHTKLLGETTEKKKWLFVAAELRLCVGSEGGCTVKSWCEVLSFGEISSRDVCFFSSTVLKAPKKKSKQFHGGIIF